MKYIPYPLLLLLGLQAPVMAQSQLSDRWKETQRLDMKDKEVAYTDTLRLTQVNKDGMNLRKGGFQYKGSISNDLLDFGGVTFGIVKNSEHEIRLRDEEFIHIFTREIKDLSAADAGAVKSEMDLPAQPVAQIDPALIQGKWEAYRRQSKNGPMPKIDYSRMIRSLEIPGKGSGDIIGKVSAGGEGDLYLVKGFDKGNIKVTYADGAPHQLTVWKLTSTELIIEDGGIIYYMKQFR